MLLLLARSDAEDELAVVDLAELAVEAATGGIPLAEEAGLGCLAFAVAVEEYSLSIREDSPPMMPAPKPIEREGITSWKIGKEEREERTLSGGTDML